MSSPARTGLGEALSEKEEVTGEKARIRAAFSTCESQPPWGSRVRYPVDQILILQFIS